MDPERGLRRGRGEHPVEEHPRALSAPGVGFVVAIAAEPGSNVARERGARALEGYPMLTEPRKEITWSELHVGSRSIFAAAGFAEVGRPSLRRVVMRIDF